MRILILFLVVAFLISGCSNGEPITENQPRNYLQAGNSSGNEAAQKQTFNIEFEEVAFPALPNKSANVLGCNWRQTNFSGDIIVRNENEYNDFASNFYEYGYEVYKVNKKYPANQARYKDYPNLSKWEFIKLCNVIPKADFYTQSLIGKTVHIKGGGSIESKRVIRDDSKKTVVLEINTSGNNYFDTTAVFTVLLTVPKIPLGYNVSFVENQRLTD